LLKNNTIKLVVDTATKLRYNYTYTKKLSVYFKTLKGLKMRKFTLEFFLGHSGHTPCLIKKFSSREDAVAFLTTQEENTDYAVLTLPTGEEQLFFNTED
jgi:hypothetical protein